MGNKSSVPQVTSSYENSRRSAPTRRSFIKCPDSNYSSENSYNSIMDKKDKTDGRKSSISFEPQINNILLSINRDAVKPSAYKQKNVKSKKGIKMISSLSLSRSKKEKRTKKKTKKKTDWNDDAVETPDIMPTFSDITTATSRSSSKMTTTATAAEVKSTLLPSGNRNNSQEIHIRRRVGLRRDYLTHTKEIIDPLVEQPSQEAPLLPCMDKSQHTSILGQNFHVKQRKQTSKDHHQKVLPPLPPSISIIEQRSEKSEHTKNGQTNAAAKVDNKCSSGATYPEDYGNYELLKSFVEDESQFLEESIHTTVNDGIQQYIVPVSSDDSTVISPTTVSNLCHSETSMLLNEECNSHIQPPTQKYEGLDESGIDQSILDLIEKEEDEDRSIRNEPSPRPIFKDERTIRKDSNNDGNLLPPLNDEESTSSEFQFVMNEVTILRNEDRLSPINHAVETKLNQSYWIEKIAAPINCESHQLLMHQDSSTKIHEPAFTRQAISNASFLFANINKEERISSTHASTMLADDIERRISHINIEESSKRLSGGLQHLQPSVSDFYVNDLLEKAKKNEERRKASNAKLPFRGLHFFDVSTVINVELQNNRSVEPKRKLSELPLEMKLELLKADETAESIENAELISAPNNGEVHPLEQQEVCFITPGDVMATNHSETTQSSHSINRSFSISRKSHSPFIRFKSAMRHFEKPFTQDGNVPMPIYGKSPTRMMLSSTGFVVNTVTELNGRLRRNIQRPPKNERRVTMGNDVTIAPRRAKLFNPLFRPNENKNNEICSNEADLQCVTHVEWGPPREILCDLVNRIPNPCERRISKITRVEQLVDKLPGYENRSQVYDQACDYHSIKFDNEKPNASSVESHTSAEYTTSQMRPVQSSNSSDSLKPSTIVSELIDNHQTIHATYHESNPTDYESNPPYHENNFTVSELGETHDPLVEELGENHVATDLSYTYPSEKVLIPTSFEGKDVYDEVNSQKLVSWSLEDLISEQDEKLTKPIDSPTDYSISLCSGTLISVTPTNDATSALTGNTHSQTNPYTLCLSPTQRTPMQAKKWRTLAAQAEAKKSNTHKKSKKTKGLRRKEYTDV